jgi:hypothetical protein
MLNVPHSWQTILQQKGRRPKPTLAASGERGGSIAMTKPIVRLLYQIGYQQRDQEYRSQESEPQQKALKAYFRMSLP